jgi:hypothetical protein
MTDTDHELECLLSLDGHEFQFAAGYVVKFEAARIAATKGRPHGIKYNLTLHDPTGRRVFGLDNAHGIRRGVVYDHRHVQAGRKVRSYTWRGPAELLEDFYAEVERILKERGVR